MENQKINRFNIVKSLKAGAHEVYHTLLRFPLTVVMLLVLAAIVTYQIEMPYDRLKDIRETLNRLTGVLVLGVPLSLSVSVLFERCSKRDNILTRLAAYGLEILVLGLYYMFLFENTEMVSMVRLIFNTGAMVLAFLFIPYLLNKENFEIYITELISRLIVTVLYTIVAALGIMAILFAVQSLLYNDMSSKAYIYTWILAWIVFAPIHFLGGLPSKDDRFSIHDYSKVLKILLMYIVLPILSVYTVVLYVYFGKIMITQEWPRGIVSYLVLSYSAVGIATLFLITPFVKENSWARIFKAAFSKLILPLLVMMFIAIGIRIEAFGVTENRYLILIAGIWSAFAMIFINLAKGKKNIILAISLALTCLLMVNGPLSAFNVSRISQNRRFYNILKKYDMVQGNTIVKSNTEVEQKDKKEITEILYYFNGNHGFEALKYMPEGFNMAKMEAVFGFEGAAQDPRFTNYFSYYSQWQDYVDISGYDVMFRYQGYKHDRNDTSGMGRTINSSYGELRIKMEDDDVLLLSRDNQDLIRMNLSEYVKNLHAKYPNFDKGENVPHDELITVVENDKARVKFVFQGLYGQIDNGQEPQIREIDIQILIDFK
jgi:hypothetical protein